MYECMYVCVYVCNMCVCLLVYLLACFDGCGFYLLVAIVSLILLSYSLACFVLVLLGVFYFRLPLVPGL